MEQTVKLKEKYWDSPAEKNAFNILKKYLNCVDYEVHSHVTLRDIFDSLDEEMKHQHVDFLITTTAGKPVMGIEINGSYHLTDDFIRARDKEKKKLFLECDLPFLSIPISELENKNSFEELEIMIIHFLFGMCYRPNIPFYCPDCDHRLHYAYSNTYRDIRYVCDVCKEKIPRKRYMFNYNEEVASFALPFNLARLDE